MSGSGDEQSRGAQPGVRLTLPSNPRYLAVIRAALRCMSGQEGFPEDVTDQLALATDEALANVIKHGYEGREDGAISLVLRPLRRRAQRGLEIVILDRGRTVDPAVICGRDLADLRPGGLGVHIIRSVMDKVRYRPRRGGGMVLRMVKFHEGGTPAGGAGDPQTEGKG